MSASHGTTQLATDYQGDARGSFFLLSFGCLYLIFEITCVVFPAVEAMRFAGKSQCCLKVIFYPFWERDFAAYVSI